MKTLLACFITALITSASAFGAATWTQSSYGVLCKSTTDGIIGCLPTSGRGYGVGISRDMVAIYDIRRHRMVTTRYQP